MEYDWAYTSVHSLTDKRMRSSGDETMSSNTPLNVKVNIELGIKFFIFNVEQQHT